MSETWVVVVCVGAASLVLKAAGPVVLGGRKLPARIDGAVELLVPALLAALVVTQAFASGDDLSIDARALGLAAALVAVAMRAPVIVVVAVAAAVTALGRL